MGPGDEVLCVDARHACTQCGCETSPEYVLPEIGRQYIVERVATGACVMCRREHPVLRTVGCPLPYPYAWPASWFRPLRYDSDEQLVGTDVMLPVRIKETV